MTALAVAIPDVAVVSEEGGKSYLDYSQFHRGQREAYWSTARFTLVLAGTQGGKTAVGPPWLLKQIQERGPGDYMVVGPTFTLMEKKALPEFLRLFEDALNLGKYNKNNRTFTFTRESARRLWGVDSLIPTRVFFGYGENPNSLESATIKAVWIDEGGQKEFKRESWDAILRRLSIEEGPVLLTSTPYLLGWLSELVKKAKELGVKVINFPSIANPRFPRTEWERAKAALPPWKFNMFYRGVFERPAGMIYGCWSEENVIPAFTIPEHWLRFLGLDFGGVNTCGLFIAKELNHDNQPTGRYIGYREYLSGGKTAAEHSRDLLRGEPRIPVAYGGSKSEGQWRDEFAAAGLGVLPPVVTEVEVGINRVYSMIAPDEEGLRQFLVLDSMKSFIDELLDYKRPVDENGEPMEGIEDQHAYHRMDAARYILSYLARPIVSRIWL